MVCELEKFEPIGIVTVAIVRDRLSFIELRSYEVFRKIYDYKEDILPLEVEGQPLAGIMRRSPEIHRKKLVRASSYNTITRST